MCSYWKSHDDDDGDLHAIVRGFGISNSSSSRIMAAPTEIVVVPEPEPEPEPEAGSSSCNSFSEMMMVMMGERSNCSGSTKSQSHHHSQAQLQCSSMAFPLFSSSSMSAMDLQSFAAAASMACSSSSSSPPSSAALATLPRADTKPSCEPQLAPVSPSPSPSPSPAPSAKAQGAKRRKAQQKRIVCVPVAGGSSRPSGGEGVPSDLWAWRKYGQKPIKGSPYPRGYYRCSSSKGCSARKQVERSRTDPSMLVITYTSDHNHPWPTHRNALAGSTRQQQQQHTTPPQNQQQPTFNSSNGATAGGTANDNDNNKSSSSNSSGNGNGRHVQDNNSKNNALLQQNNNNNHSSNRPPGPENNNPHEHCDVAPTGATVAVVIDQKQQPQFQPQQHKHNCNGNGNDDSCYCGGTNNNIIGTITCAAGSTMELSVEDSQHQQQADDFFADLGELPDSLYVFEDDSSSRSDEDAVVLDPFNLFTWSSSSSSSSSSATAPLHAKSAMF